MTRYKEMKALREQGETLQSIADKFGVTRERVRQILRKREPSAGFNTGSNAEKKDRNAEIKRLRKEGWSLNDLAKHFGISQPRVYEIIGQRSVVRPIIMIMFLEHKRQKKILRLLKQQGLSINNDAIPNAIEAINLICDKGYDLLDAVNIWLNREYDLEELGIPLSVRERQAEFDADVKLIQETYNFSTPQGAIRYAVRHVAKRLRGK